MDKEQRTTEFAVFCIENTAARVQMKGTDIFRELMKSNGIEQFVYPSYATLHTQSKEYIVNEVLDYITRHNPHFLKTNTKTVSSTPLNCMMQVLSRARKRLLD